MTADPAAAPAAGRRSRVLLVAMPFASPHHPNLGLSLLQAALRRDGIACDVRYPCLDFIEIAGVRRYQILADERVFSGLVGEWLFSGLVHGEDAASDLRYCTEILMGQMKDLFPPDRLLEVLSARAAAAELVERTLRELRWEDYTMVGFTTSSQQTMASLALAKRVKEQHPGLVIALGGANCEGEMGVELHRRYPFIDVVCSGEADISFPEIVRRHAAGQDLSGVPATVIRQGSETVVHEVSSLPVEDMDSLPYPDFSDFYDQHARLPSVAAAYPPVPLLETARGCWWGARKHCTFCGLNGSTMAFRSKSSDRALDELGRLVERYGHDVLVVDNILDMAYFDSLLPRIAAAGWPLLVHFETKVNLTPRHVSLLAAAGIRKIQPGIESLDTEVLRLMEKGCTLMQNVQLLKLAAEHGVRVDWNFLYGFPGETADAYARMARLAPRFYHLNPPVGMGRVRADRFSPYFSRPERYGVQLSPMPAYRHVFPWPEDQVRRLAYHFAMDGEPLADAEVYTAEATSAMRRWRAEETLHELYSVDDGRRIEVVRRRPGRDDVSWVLEGARAAVVRYCWRSRTRAQIGRAFPELPAAAIDAAIAELDAAEILLCEGARCLALALRQPGFRRGVLAEELREAAARAHVQGVLSDEGDDTAPPPERSGLVTLRRAGTGGAPGGPAPESVAETGS
jgi:ribosomal peptide maturation radical SAM protein 1